MLPATDPAPDADQLRIPVGPGSLHVDRYGHGGAPIILLHGFGTSCFLWRTVGPALASARHTAYGVDLFGYGESDRPFDAEFGIAAQAEYLDRALTALRVSSAVFVGVDLGGAIAIRLAATRPERVDGLVLVNAIAFDEVPAKDIRTLQRNTARFAFRLSRGVLGVAPLLSSLLEGSVASLAHMPDRLVARYLAPYVGREGVSHLLALARSVEIDDLEEVEFPLLATPTLLIAGDADQWVPHTIAERLAGSIPDAQLVTLPGVARLVPEEAPDELARLIVEFVESRSLAVQRRAKASSSVEPTRPTPRGTGELV